jgi:hypothetical protein
MKLKIHIKIKGKPACGVKKQKRPLRYAENEGEATCERCKRVVSK